MEGGFHVDVQQKQLMFWAIELDGRLDRIIAAWPGWEVIWLEDKFEAHQAATRGHLIFPAYSEEEQIARFASALMQNMEEQNTGLSESQGLLDYAAKKIAEGHTVQLNPNALIQNPLQLSAAIKREILDSAIAAWKKKVH